MGATVVAAILVSGGAAQVSSGPPAPTNLEVVSKTDTSITLAWGPSVPGPMSEVAETANSVTIAWGASEDSRSPIASYDVSKDGKSMGTTTTTQYKFQVQRKVNSFNVCVNARTQSGLIGPQRCVTFTRNGSTA